MLNNTEFINIPIINQLATDPYWSVSLDFHQSDSGQKVPMHWLKWHEQHLIRMYNLKDSTTDQYPYDALTILPNINADPTFNASNRTYRLHAEQNHIFVLDIEPNASPETVKQLSYLPCTYIERSQHNGYHILIQVDEPLSLEFKDVLSKSVIKGPIDSNRPFDDPENKPQFECIFNNHFITFTRNAIPFNVNGDHGTPSELRHNLRQFLLRLRDWSASTIDLDDDLDVKLPSKIELDHDDYATDALLKLIDNSRRFQSRIQDYISLPVSEFNNDPSRQEMSIACKLTGLLLNVRDNRCSFIPDNPTVNYKNLSQQINFLDDSHLIQFVAYLLTENLDPNQRIRHKNKYATKRDGMPYLMYLAKQAFIYTNTAYQEEHSDQL